MATLVHLLIFMIVPETAAMPAVSLAVMGLFVGREPGAARFSSLGLDGRENRTSQIQWLRENRQKVPEKP